MHEHRAIGRRLLQRIARFQRRQRTMRLDHFPPRARQLIQPPQQLVTKPRGQPLARQRQQLTNRFDAQLAEQRGGVVGDAQRLNGQSK